MQSAGSVTRPYSRPLWLIGSEMIVVGSTLGIAVYTMMQVLKLQDRVDAIEQTRAMERVTRGDFNASDEIIENDGDVDTDEEENEHYDDHERDTIDDITQHYGTGSGVLDDVVEEDAGECASRDGSAAREATNDESRIEEFLDEDEEPPPTG